MSKIISLSIKVLFLLCVVKVSAQLKYNAQILKYDKNKVENTSNFVFNGKTAVLTENNNNWTCSKSESGTISKGLDVSHTFKLDKGASATTGVALNFTFENWTTDNYVVLPSAAYNGNRFEVLKYGYPPLFKSGDYKVDISTTITDIPRLNNKTGESRMDFNTGDMSTPAIGIYFPKQKKGIWILTEQATNLGNSVLSFVENENRTKAEFMISAPCVREQKYGMTRLSSSGETGADWKAGDLTTIKTKIFTFENLNSPDDLMTCFLSVRKKVESSARIDQIPFSAAFKLMEDQQNNEWWDEKNNLYTFGGEGWNMKFQLGWVGGCMVTYPLTLTGGQISKERSFKNYNRVITESQAKSGFYYSCGNGKEWCSDCFSNPFPDNLLLLRKDADALYYFYKYCLSQKAENPNWQMPNEWKQPLNKFVGAFVTLWNKYGQFGQFIDIETGEIKVGGSSSAAMAIGGLALAYQFEKNPIYLETAKKAARYYYQNYTRKGISTGGPSEILQNNDSESSFAMLESFVVLYDVTNEKEWLNYAEKAAAFCSTWLVSYDYKFPETTLFGKLNIRTTGSVWASTQNKHGGPGICTLSGDSLLKLYRATGNTLYLEMIGDLAHNIMQYISREDRPIGKLHSGWVNERVNLSDWEGKDRIGGIFNGNTWAQTSAMLTAAEIPGIYINTATNQIQVFDHVTAKLKDKKLIISNSTKFDATVSVFVDKNPANNYSMGFVSKCPKVMVKAGETKEVSIDTLSAK